MTGTFCESAIEEYRRLHQDIALVGTGVDLIRYRYFTAMTPMVTLNAIGSQYWVRVFKNLSDPREDYRWAEAFVVETFLNWQELGLAPRFYLQDSVLEQARERLAEFEERSQTSPAAEDKEAVSSFRDKDDVPF